MSNAASTLSGSDLREMASAATNWLEKSASDIDALNVFPVPDGDCGTNMLLTMKSGVEEAFRLGDKSVSEISQAIAKGALMGARGNSGVITSQIWRGISQSLKDKRIINAKDWADAWLAAVDTAYKGLSNPVEGTILTVLKDAAKAAQMAAKNGATPADVTEAEMLAASESVALTPSLLPALHDAGVVDAGGQGLFTLLEGMTHYLRGETEQMQFRKSRVIAASVPVAAKPMHLSPPDEEAFGY